MTDGTQELDEIVREFIRSAYQKPESTFLNAIYYQKFKKELLDWHNKQVLEIIGEDDTVFLPGFNGRKYDVLVRNKLRAEQRNKLKER